MDGKLLTAVKSSNNERKACVGEDREIEECFLAVVRPRQGCVLVVKRYTQHYWLSAVIETRPIRQVKSLDIAVYSRATKC